MFGFRRNMRLFIRQIIRQESKSFRQYVGDDTILLSTEDEMFIYLDGRDASLTPSILREGTWEPQLSGWLQNVLREGDCFVDIGGNNGIHALRAGRKVGATGRIIVFEPQERLANLIERSASANLMVYNLHVRRWALGAGEGTIRLGKFAHLTGSATVTANQLIIEHVEVPLTTLPVALAQLAHEIGAACEPDVIKIDVEGFEYDVWDGMKAWTRKRERLAIVLEYSPTSYRNSGRDAYAFLCEMIDYGFIVEQLHNDGTKTLVSNARLTELAESQAQYDILLTKGHFP